MADTPRDILLAAFAHEEVRPVPFTLWLEDDRLEPAFRARFGDDWRALLPPYTVGCDLVDTGLKHPVPGDPARRVDLFGNVWRVDRRPDHIERPALPEPTLDGYRFPDPAAFEPPGAFDRALAACAKHGGESVTMSAVLWGMFERSWTMRGFENALADMLAEPDFHAELLDRLTDLHLALTERILRLPVDAVFFSDDWGDQRGVVMGPELWRTFYKPRWARIYAAVHAAGKLNVAHCCGSCADILPDLVEIGLDALESVQPEAAGMNPYELKKRFGNRLTFWGGLGTQSLLPRGTPAEVAAEARRLACGMGRGGGYILAAAKALQSDTPPDNAVALLDAFLNQNGPGA